MRMPGIKKIMRRFIVPTAAIFTVSHTAFANGEESWEDVSDMDIASNQSELIVMDSTDDEADGSHFNSVKIHICEPQKCSSPVSQPGSAQLQSEISNKTKKDQKEDLEKKPTNHCLLVPVMDIQHAPILKPIQVDTTTEQDLPKLSLKQYKDELKLIKKEKVYCDCTMPKCTIL